MSETSFATSPILYILGPKGPWIPEESGSWRNSLKRKQLSRTSLGQILSGSRSSDWLQSLITPDCTLGKVGMKKSLYMKACCCRCCCCQVTSVVSDCVWPHRQQPTRLLCPWDSPGKNTGVGCHFLLQWMKVKSESEVAQSCPTLSDPMDCSLPGSFLRPWDFPGKSTGVGCHCLLQYESLIPAYLKNG